jgi:catechol 2,3-dioxygenase-like lactoylglutathione lyase family enzyme
MVTAKIEVVFVPVTDVDRAKTFYVDALGWHADYDSSPGPGVRFVQITPPGSACSIAFGNGLTTEAMEPGSLKAIMLVIDDADAAYAELIAAGVDASPVEDLSWGRFIRFPDPDGNTWTLQQFPQRS